MLGVPYAALALEIIERIFVDVEIDLRRGAQNAIVDEIAPGNDDDRPGSGLLLMRHAGIQAIRRPHELGLDEVIDGVLGPAVDRRDPAGRPAAGRILENVERLLDGLALAICLQIAVAGNVMAGAGKGGDRLRPELGAASVAE